MRIVSTKYWKDGSHIVQKITKEDNYKKIIDQWKNLGNWIWQVEGLKGQWRDNSDRSNCEKKKLLASENFRLMQVEAKEPVEQGETKDTSKITEETEKDESQMEELPWTKNEGKKRSMAIFKELEKASSSQVMLPQQDKGYLTKQQWVYGLGIQGENILWNIKASLIRWKSNWVIASV